ncbi:MAG: DUF1674 domain-containing protein [Sphingopyxis sp.]
MSEKASTPRATRRPAHIAAPAHWQKDDGPPTPPEVPFTPREEKGPHGEKGRPDPVRYGDWERKGIAVDF